MAATPGPWRIDHSTIMGEDGDPVCIITDPCGPANGERIEWPWLYEKEKPPPSFETAEDNARLIAAVPELYEALRAMVGLVDFLHEHPKAEARRFLMGARNTNDGTVSEHGALLQARAAIAKATLADVGVARKDGSDGWQR